MKTQLTIKQLADEFKSFDFVLKTQRQIAKDFNTSGAPMDSSFEKSPLNYEEIITAIGGQLAELMKLGETQTLQLLYQIDIPQTDFLALTTDPDFIPKMSDLILKREAYKVYLRSKYSN